MMSLTRFIVLVTLIFTALQVAEATRIYQWKDASGVVHFTDSKSKVPAAFRDDSSRDLKSLPIVSEFTEMAVENPVLDGKALYESKCAACHVTGVKDEGSREGLFWAIIDSKTKFPRSPSDLFKEFRSVADGSIDMPKMDISDEDLMKIAKYLIKIEKVEIVQ